MATVTEIAESTYLTQVGETAGLVWRTLDEEGPVALTKLPKLVDAPREIVLVAIGWLAREDKITVVEAGRKRTVSLV